MRLTFIYLAVATFVSAHAQNKDGDLLNKAGAAQFTKSFDGVQIAYEVAGAGQPVVFVHGWSCDRSYWVAQFDHFKKTHRVVIVDLAGHGDSGEERGEYTMLSFGKDVAAVVDALKLTNVILVGHSMGGDVVTEAAVVLRGKVAGVVLADDYKNITEGRDSVKVEEFVSGIASDFKKNAATLVKTFFLPTSDQRLATRIIDDMTSTDPKVAINELRHALHYGGEFAKRRAMITAPVVALNADDQPTDMESMKRYNIDVVIMKGTGHFLAQERAEEFNEVLGRVCKSFN